MPKSTLVSRDLFNVPDPTQRAFRSGGALRGYEVIYSCMAEIYAGVGENVLHISKICIIKEYYSFTLRTMKST